jgi:hypothetical protein
MRRVVIQYGVFLLECIRAASADIRQRVRAGLKLSGGFFQGDLRVREAASKDGRVWQERGRWCWAADGRGVDMYVGRTGAARAIKQLCIDRAEALQQQQELKRADDVSTID